MDKKEALKIMLPSFQIPNINRDNVVRAITKTIFLLFNDKINRVKSKEWTNEDELNLNKLIHEHLLWKLSENLNKAKGKYEGNIYWSVEAIKSYVKYSGIFNRLGVPDALSHEHITPRKKFTDYLILKYKKQVLEEDLYEDLKNKGFAVVVTNSEHHSLDDNYLDFNDVWKRYYKSNSKIKIFYNDYIPKSILTELKRINMLVNKIDNLKFEKTTKKIVNSKFEKTTNNINNTTIRSKKYQRDQRVKLLVDSNPKQIGSKSYKRFNIYYNKITVGEFLDKGGLTIDLKWDTEHNFIKII